MLRRLIVEGGLPEGTRLPSSRQLADALGVSRTTVIVAVDRLLGEGYLIGRRGSGTYVSTSPGRSGVAPTIRGGSPEHEPRLSQRATALVATPRYHDKDDLRPDDVMPFRIGVPAIDQFPVQQWARVLGAAWREIASGGLGYVHPFGHRRLRRRIAEHLSLSRGLAVDADQIVIVAGPHSGLDICFRLLLDPGDLVAVEDPGYLGARTSAAAAGASLVGIPVDCDGMQVEQLASLAAPPRAVLVTPIHQFPLGMALSRPRRTSLVRWAERTGAWVLEVDFYGQGVDRRSTDLAVLDRCGQVISIGTFNQALYPSIGLAYLVLPPGLVDAFEAMDLWTDISPPILGQAAVTRFMEEGHFARHLRKIHELHTERRHLLLEHAARLLGGALTLPAEGGGLHLVGYLTDGADDVEVAASAARCGVDVWPLSLHTFSDQRQGLLLGYGGVAPARMQAAVERLAAALEATGHAATAPTLAGPLPSA